MKTFIISLPEAAARRESIRRQMECLGLEFEFIPGVLAKALSDTDRARDYDRRKALRTQCRDLAPAEIGIALSHLKIYRRMAEERIRMALVLEDDVIMPPELPSLLSSLEPLLAANKPTVTLLSPAQSRKGRVVQLANGRQLLPFRKGYYAHGYVVTYSGARALLRFLYPVGDVADCWARLVRHKVVDVQVVEPPLLEQDRGAFGSSTTEGVLALGLASSLMGKAVFKARRAFWLACDSCIGAYDRRFRPYAGVFEDTQTLPRPP
jgi:glycosyl transferase family 25